jgi:hypothetical protein
MEDVPCEDLADAIAGLVKHGAFKAMRQHVRKIVEVMPRNGDASPPICIQRKLFSARTMF